MASGACQGPGFSAEPGSVVVFAGSYIVEAVQSQVVLPQGPAGRRGDLVRSRYAQGGSKDHRLDAE